MLRNSAILAGALALTACATSATSPGTEGISEISAPGFACPKPGTAATFNNARSSVVFEGAVPGQPSICQAKTTAGVAQRRIVNYLITKPEYEARMTQALAGLFPLTPGRTARFSSFFAYSNDPTTTGEMRETWTVIGAETLDIVGRRLDTVVVEREMDNPQTYGSSGATWKLWFAPSLGIWVKAEQRSLRGLMRPQAPSVLTNLRPPPV